MQTRSPRPSLHQSPQQGKRDPLHIRSVASHQCPKEALGSLTRRHAGGNGEARQFPGSVKDLASALRSALNLSPQKASNGAPAAAAATAAQTLFGASAASAAAEAPPSPPPLDELAEAMLAGQGAVQEDPVAAARQLQAFLAQYREQYGPETDARIAAAVARLQDYVDGYGGGGDAGAAADVAGAGSGSGGVYHNYILEQLTGVLDWVNGLLMTNPKPYVYDAYGRVVSDPAAAAGAEAQQEQLRAASSSLRLLIQQLQQANQQYSRLADTDERAALGQVLSQLTTMADRLAAAAARRPLPPLGAAGGEAAAAAATAGGGGGLAPYVPPAHLYGADGYRDPLLRVLDGVYEAVVVDSGLREFLAGVKQLGDSLAASMAAEWTGAPPLGRLIAYIAAVAGVLFVMRTRLPQALLAPTRRLLSLGSGDGRGGGDVADEAPGSTTTVESAGGGGEGSFAAPLHGRTAGMWVGGNNVAPAASLAAAAGNGAGASGSGNGSGWSGGDAAPWGEPYSNGAPLTALHGGGGGWGYGGGAPAQELQAAVASSSNRGSNGNVTSNGNGSANGNGNGRSGSGGGPLGSGWAALMGRSQQAAASSPSSNGLLAPSPGASPAAAAAAGSPLPQPPPGGWTSAHSDRADWWSFGRQQHQAPQQQQPPGPHAAVATASEALLPPPGLELGTHAGYTGGSRPRSAVAESWEAFRRIHATVPAAAPVAVDHGPAVSTPEPSHGTGGTGGGGVLDTTAALAAAAVAAAVRAGGGATSTTASTMHPYNSHPSAAAAAAAANLARAAEQRLAASSEERSRLRATLKDRLRWVCLALGPVSSVVPGGEPLRGEVDALLAALEELSPTDTPLNTAVDAGRHLGVRSPSPAVDPLLLGDWRLVYASNALASGGGGGAGGSAGAASSAGGGGSGPNLLAQLLQLADSLPGFGMSAVMQRLSLPEPSTSPSSPSSYPSPAYSPRPSYAVLSAASTSASSSAAAANYTSASAPTSVPGSACVVTENSAVFRFGPLGSWRVTVRGRWIDNGGGLCAAAEFDSFSVRPVDLWGLPLDSLLPEVVVPVPEALRSRSEWCTTYLDEDMRIGRGAGGALFLFRRGAPEPAPGLGAGTGVGVVAGVGDAGAEAAWGAAAAAAGRNPVLRPL